MTIKRNPAIKSDHLHKYERISKADLVEAFRDFARDVGGFGETDETLWFAELERRVEVVREQRKAGNSMLHVWRPVDNEKTLFGSDKPPVIDDNFCAPQTGWGDPKCPTCGKCRQEIFVQTNDKPPKPIGFVIRRTSWHCFLCDKCEQITISPNKLQYAGDGDYDCIRDDKGVWVVMSIAEWQKLGLAHDGKLITAFVERHRNILDDCSIGASTRGGNHGQ